MAKVQTIAGPEDLEDLLNDYWRELQTSRLADKSIEDYYYFALCFARWVAGEFTPGANVR